eukprot:15539-Heterococcus_DN1.PRE.2
MPVALACAAIAPPATLLLFIGVMASGTRSPCTIRYTANITASRPATAVLQSKQQIASARTYCSLELPIRAVVLTLTKVMLDANKLPQLLQPPYQSYHHLAAVVVAGSCVASKEPEPILSA